MKYEVLTSLKSNVSLKITPELNPPSHTALRRGSCRFHAQDKHSKFWATANNLIALLTLTYVAQTHAISTPSIEHFRDIIELGNDTRFITELSFCYKSGLLDRTSLDTMRVALLDTVHTTSHALSQELKAVQTSGARYNSHLIAIGSLKLGSCIYTLLNAVTMAITIWKTEIALRCISGLFTLGKIPSWLLFLPTQIAWHTEGGDPGVAHVIVRLIGILGLTGLGSYTGYTGGLQTHAGLNYQVYLEQKITSLKAIEEFLKSI